MVGLISQVWWRSLVGLSGVACFIVALRLMQSGARSVGPLVRDLFDIHTLLGALSFGWAAAYVLLSGSPVAAMAIAFFDAEEISAAAALTMITGSRIGATYVPLLIGMFYITYSRNQPLREVRIGVLALIVTFSVYTPALVIGLGAILQWGIGSSEAGANAIGEVLNEGALGEAAETAERLFPPWALFGIGLALIIVSFKLFDISLPNLTSGVDPASRLARLWNRHWTMFMLGGLVTLMSLSVTVSLGLLVPLYHRGVVRANQVIPYVLGANIATFVDTLVAAMTLERDGAIRIVLVEMGSVTVITLLVLVFAFKRYERMVIFVVEWLAARTSRFAVFVVVSAATPMAIFVLTRIFQGNGAL